MSRQLAELLLKEGIINGAQLQECEESHKKTKEDHIHFLLRQNYVQEKQIMEHFSKRYAVPSFDLSKFQVDPEVVKLLTAEDARKYKLIPVQKAKSTLVIAMADPTSLAYIDDVKFRTQLRVEAVITTFSAFDEALGKYYGVLNTLEQQAKKESTDQGVQDLGGAADAHDITNESQIDAPVITLVNNILVDAIKMKVSDIHVEPYETSFRVRYRKDGAMFEHMRPPMQVKAAVIARLKIMARMDISEKRLPQDGRIKIKTGLGEMDYRVSSMPTVWGEKMVLRLLNKGGLQADMSKLGMEKKAMDNFTNAIHQPYGMVLVTGPTGSGKTTTLYSALQELNKITDNISTAEDPVEYNLEGINQTQTHADIGLNFAACLRTLMRQDPDIILVGEIRDFETAEVGIQAALTGHLVLSTLHTNDAPSSVTRLLNMGVEPFLITAAVNLVVAQRLIRRICANCKTEMKVNATHLTALGIDPKAAAALKFYKGAGCASCANTGYAGRMGIYEVMPFTSNLKEMVLAGANSIALKKQAIAEGMKTLRMAAITKAAEGATTLEEALANTAPDF